MGTVANHDAGHAWPRSLCGRCVLSRRWMTTLAVGEGASCAKNAAIVARDGRLWSIAKCGLRRQGGRRLMVVQGRTIARWPGHDRKIAHHPLN